MNKTKNLPFHCPHLNQPAGCCLDMHANPLLLFGEAKSFFESHGITLSLQEGNPMGWRCRAKLAVRGTAQYPLIGLFAKGSHQVIDMPQCCMHHPAINQAAEAVRQWIRDQAIAPYDESAGTGTLRYLQLAVDRATNRIQLTLVLNQDANAKTLLLPLKALWEQHHGLWHSLWLNFNTRRDNVIFSGSWQLLYGEEWLWDSFCGRRVCFHPASFAQANPEMFERLLQEIQLKVPSGAHCVEFYAGVGVIGLTLVDQCQSISCIEIVPLAQQCFQEALHLLTPEQQGKLSYVCGPSSSALSRLQAPANVVIVDPPRKGLEAALLKALCVQPNIHTLVYVSCGWPSFVSDSQQLLAAGWRITSASAYLFFPGTNHLETLAVFQRGEYA